MHSTGEFFDQSNKEDILKETAQILRNDTDHFICNEKQQTPVWPPTFKSMKSCRQRYPISLNLFFNHLLKNKTHSVGERIGRYVESFSDDVIHSVSNGSILTFKQTLIG